MALFFRFSWAGIPSTPFFAISTCQNSTNPKSNSLAIFSKKSFLYHLDGNDPSCPGLKLSSVLYLPQSSPHICSFLVITWVYVLPPLLTNKLPHNKDQFLVISVEPNRMTVPRDGMRMGFVIQEVTYLPQKVGEVIYLCEPSLTEKLEYECHSLCSCLVKIPDQTGNVDAVIRCLFPSPPPMLPILYASSQSPFCSSGMPCPLPWHWVSLDIKGNAFCCLLKTSPLIYMKIWGIF